MGIEEILADYEDLEKADILAVLTFATRLAQVKTLQESNYFTPIQTRQALVQ
ncbi:hypothetical protein THIOM_002038 [Candidatus Thiomargarita nelsonii]|uniref:Uncharacterized protein n=1 Tax=Candidatus Thiomargarita nelsonii TaxID=1003181 RepID=A0A176S267_9GAMM|nr:hypothetical protein THIOM_002038 [Candidatus Thiomargarita nelsonii]